MQDVKIAEIPQIKPDNTEGTSQPAGSENVVPTANVEPMKTSNKKRYIILGALGFFLILVLLLIVPGFLVYQKGRVVMAQVTSLQAAVKSQDITKISLEIDKTKKAVSGLKTSATPLFWAKFLPYFGVYLKDADHALSAAENGLDAAGVLITTVSPYADILGLTGGGGSKGGDGAKTSQERIDFLVKSIPDLIPKMDILADKAKKIQADLDAIDPERYPIKFRGKLLRANMVKAKDLATTVTTFIINGKPLLTQAPYLLGIDSKRTYMVVFQNDKELRPTGGFITAYSIMSVEKGKFSPVISSDIYALDNKYRPTIAAPLPMIKYLRGPYAQLPKLRLRDMNWSPDFADSMKTFTMEAAKAGISNIDGVIGVDTQLLVNLLNVLGPIGVSGFGNFSTTIVPECKCAQVIHELEAFADVEGPIVWDPAGNGKIIYRPPNSDNRKKIIGPLMNSVLANAIGQPKDKLPALFEAGFKSLLEKHVLFYLFDPKAQSAAEAFGIAGRIRDYTGDYLHISDANLGGRKSNLYATEEVEQDITLGRDGRIVKTLTITYKNPEKQDGWLNSVLPNWVRVYVPKGSELVDITGLDDKADPYEEYGKKVFAGFFRLRPEGVSKVVITYKLPKNISRNYSLLIQKQPGTDGYLYNVKAGRQLEEFFLKEDKELKFKL